MTARRNQTLFQRLCTSRASLLSSGIPTASELIFWLQGPVEDFGWPTTCPKTEAVDARHSDAGSKYTFVHTNQHSGERFQVQIAPSHSLFTSIWVNVEVLSGLDDE